MVCVIGRGPIGRELARKLKAVNARPIAVSRTPDDDGDRRAGVPARALARGAGDLRRGRDLHRRRRDQPSHDRRGRVRGDEAAARSSSMSPAAASSTKPR